MLLEKNVWIHIINLPTVTTFTLGENLGIKPGKIPANIISHSQPTLKINSTIQQRFTVVVSLTKYFYERISESNLLSCEYLN